MTGRKSTAYAAAMTKLRKRKVEDWARRISRIEPVDVRSKVANIVWWDWFSQLSDHTGALSEERRQYLYGQDEDEAAVTAALRRLGYPDSLATSRGRRPRQ
jgi:hypothetical protein